MKWLNTIEVLELYVITATAASTELLVVYDNTPSAAINPLSKLTGSLRNASD